MPTHDFDAVFYVGRAPDIAFEDGLFKLSYDIGKSARFEIVMRPNVFLQAGNRARKALDAFNAGNVVPLGKAVGH